MEDSGAISKAKKLLERQKAVVSLDREDFVISKNIASGNGISERAREIWGQDRAIVNIPILDPAVNGICHRFDTNPFSFGIKPGFPGADALFDSKELTASLSRALREICWDGISYIFAYHAGSSVRFRVLDNLNAVYGKCRFADGSDCRECLYVDKISETEIKEQYPDFYIENGSIADYSGVDRQENEREEVTYWEKTESGVKASKIIGGRLADESELPLSRLPIIRITGKKVWTRNKGENWRGLPYNVSSLLETLTFAASLLKERLATAPTFNYWVAQESASDHETAAQMAKMNGFPRACGFYRAVSESGMLLPQPERVDKRADIAELSEQISSLVQTINATAGSVAGIAPNAGTETAESVLLRRESKETATDEFLRNLLEGANSIAAVMKEFFAMLGFPVDEIAVSESIFVKAKEQADSQKISAYVGFLGQNPQSMDFAGVLLETLGLEEDRKQSVLGVLAEIKQKEAQGMQQMQEQIQQGAQMLQQAQGENQALQQQLAIAGKQASDLQQMNFEMQSDSRARILMEEMKLKNDIVKKQMDMQMERDKLALEYAKLGLKAGTDSAKIDIEAAKAENNAAKAENAAKSNAIEAAELAAEQTETINNAFEEAMEHPTDGGLR